MERYSSGAATERCTLSVTCVLDRAYMEMEFSNMLITAYLLCLDL